MRNIVYALVLLSWNLTFAQYPNKNLKGVDEEIQNMLNAYKAVGLSVAIVQQDTVIYSKGFGYRDYENKLPVTSNTIFGVGSNTKAFTAALIGVLEKEGKLFIREKPSKYVPGLEFSTDKMNNLITVEDLLDHRSGLGSLDGSYILFPAENRLKLMDRLPFLKQNGAPKDSWMYSNFGYIILGTIAEQVATDSWDNLIREKLFKPLQMSNSNTSVDEMIKQKNFSYPYGIYKDKVERLLFQIPNNDKPGAAVNSSVADMANWVRMWLNYGKFGGYEVLPKDFARDAMSAKAIINGNPPVSPEQKNYMFGYGYGWNTRIFRGHFKVDHGGAVSGFSSNVVLFPAENFGIVVLSNQQNSDLPYTVANMIANRMLGLSNGKPYKYEMERYDIVKPENNIATLIDEQHKPTHSVEAYCGEYVNKGYGTIKVSMAGNNLVAIFPAFRFMMEHRQFDCFRLKLTDAIPQQMDPDFNFNFMLNDKGVVDRLEMDIQKSTIFRKVN